MFNLMKFYIHIHLIREFLFNVYEYGNLCISINLNFVYLFKNLRKNKVGPEYLLEVYILQHVTRK